MFNPKPAQPGGPPIWVGGNSDPAFRRIAALGDGWNADDVSLDQLKNVTERLQATSQENGRPVEISLRRTVDLRPAAAEAGLIPAPSAAGGIKHGKWPGSSTGALTGSLAEIKAFIDQVAAAGVSHYIFQFEHSTQDEHLAQIELFARELPAK